MIGKLTKGTSHAGALRYDNEKKGVEFIESNCSSQDPNKIAGEMETVAASNPRCKNTCLHLSMAAPDGERLTDEQWKQAVAIARRELGLENHQFSMTRHTDSEHDHVHIVVNRIDADGKAWCDSKDYTRVMAAMRVCETEMGLQPMEEHQATNDGRFEKTRSDLNESLKASKGLGLDHFKGEMKDRGYSIVENKSEKTGKISGISIKSDTDGKTWKASELRKGGYRGMERQLNEEQKEEKNKEKDTKNSWKTAGLALASTAKKSMGALGSAPRMPAIPTTAAGAGKKIMAGALASAEQHFKKIRESER